MFLRQRLLSVPRHGTGLTLAVATFAIGLGVGASVAPLTGGRAIEATASPAPATLPVPVRSPNESVILRTAHPAEVLRVIDGDTFEARVLLWPGLAITTKVRLRGIDAPEMRARCTDERSKAEAARDALKALLDQGEVGISHVTLDKYGGRVVADTSTSGTADVSLALLEAGLARSYSGGRRQSWCS